LFGPYYGLEEQLQIVMAVLANVPVSQMKVITPGKGIMYGLLTNIACKGFHGTNAPY
jgi:hypothetical protein